MSNLGSWKIDDYLTFHCNTHDPDTGVATDADSVPTYRVYEDETGAAILNGSMVKLDDGNTTGFYSEQIQLTAANGFEKGKCYVIYISATVDSDTGTMHHTLQIEAEVDVNTVSETVTFADDSITAAKIATDAITSDELAASALNEIADAILTRDWTSVSGEAARSVLNALRALRNKISTGDSTLTITEEDDETTAWTAEVTTGSTNPISEIDPCGEVGGPTISPDGGTFDYSVLVTITSETPGNTIYYTTDGSDPDENDNEYYGPFPITSTTTIKAVGCREGCEDSAISSSTITINAPPARFDVSDGTYIKAHGAQTVDGFSRQPDYKAMDGIYMLGLDDEADGDDEYLDFDIDADNDTFYIWIRVTATPYCKLQLRVDAGGYTDVTVCSTDDVLTGWEWHWMEVGSYALNGNHTIRVRRKENMTRPAPKIDALFFTTDGGAEPPELYLIHPAGGERWPFGNNQEITWKSSGDLTNVKLEVSYDGGETYESIVDSTANDDSYTWSNVPNEAKSDCKIRISDPDNADIFDVSVGSFCITADTNPFDTSITLEDKLHHTVGEKPWEQGDRETYLEDLEDMGALQYPFSCWAFLYLGSGDDHEPDTEAINAYRQDNGNATKLIVYNNLYSVHSQADGEDIMGSTSGHDDWFQYDELDNRVENPSNGRDCWDFGNTDFLDYFIGRVKMYVDAGCDGVFFDSLAILSKRVFENGYWSSGGVDFEIQDPREEATYTGEDWLRDFRYAISYIRRAIDKYYNNRDTIFMANNMYREHMETFGDLMDGFFREGYCGATGTYSLDDWWFDRNMWEVDVQGMALAEAEGLYTVPETGYCSGTPFNQSQNQGALFMAASVLMAIIGPDTRTHPRPQGFSDWTGWGNLKLARFVPEGRYYKTGDDVYKREFQHALVYVNPTKTNQAGISLGDNYYYLQDDGTWSGSTVSSIDLDAGESAILVIDKTWGD